MNGHIERHTSVSVTSDPAGVRHTTITQTVIGTASASPSDGGNDASVDNPGECFDINTCCDDREKAMIEMLRAYLRPDGAPDCLIERLRQCLRDEGQ